MNTFQHGEFEIDYRTSPPLPNDELNDLYAASWPHHKTADFSDVLARSLAYVCAYHAGRLVGFVYLAWDGWQHAFLLDTTVHPDYRRRGVGRRIVREAVGAAKARGGVEWVHVDFDPHLRPFYEGCGFRDTDAGLINVKSAADGRS